MIVADTNLIAYLHLSGEHSAQAEQVFLRDPVWIAPRLWRSELRNVLALYVRRQALTLPEAAEIMRAAEELLQENEYDVVSAQVLMLAQESGCSAYDCEFIAVAMKLDTKLVTMDKKLLKAFPKRAVALSAG